MIDESTRFILQRIMQVLGPETTCECSGCAYETNEAIRLLNELGIEYQKHTPRTGTRPAHDPNAERRGNDTRKE